jgi:hypothetical protein
MLGPPATLRLALRAGAAMQAGPLLNVSPPPSLELMPLRMNMGKKDKMGARQTTLLKQLRNTGML